MVTEMDVQILQSKLGNYGGAGGGGGASANGANSGAGGNGANKVIGGVPRGYGFGPSIALNGINRAIPPQGAFVSSVYYDLGPFDIITEYQGVYLSIDTGDNGYVKVTGFKW